MSSRLRHQDRIRAKVIGIGTICALSACHSVATRTNAEEDVEKAKDRVELFYAGLLDRQLDVLLPMVGPELAPDTLRLIVEGVSDTLGTMIDASVIEVGTYIESEDGVETSIDCKAEVEVDYSRGKTQEVVYLRGTNLDSAKVSGYFISLR